MKLFSLFSGYGGAEFALKQAGIPFECIGYSEIDKYAIQCYDQNHFADDGKKVKNYGDCTKINIDELPEFDLLTGGFPCQAFSQAGNKLGELDPRGTLFHQIIRIAQSAQPKYMLLENVKGLTTVRFKDTFNKILSELDRIGYKVHWKVLNSKDYGIPQSRARVWFVCIRKDLPDTFNWPQPEPLNVFIKDILEPNVDVKYHLKPEQIAKLMARIGENRAKGMGFGELPLSTSSTSSTLNSRDYKDPKVINLQPRNADRPSLLNKNAGGSGILVKEDTAYCIDRNNTQAIFQNKSQYSTNMSCPEIGQAHRVYNDDGIIPPLSSNFIASIRTRPVSGTQWADNQHVDQIEPRHDGCSNSITNVKKDNLVMNTNTFRKLTPTECFRLMGFLNDEIKLDGISNSQRYKLCGNGWALRPAVDILRNMLNLANI